MIAEGDAENGGVEFVVEFDDGGEDELGVVDLEGIVLELELRFEFENWVNLIGTAVSNSRFPSHQLYVTTASLFNSPSPPSPHSHPTTSKTQTQEQTAPN